MLKNLSFLRLRIADEKIIDAHTHIGRNCSREMEYNPPASSLLKKMKKNNVEKAVIFSEFAPEPWMANLDISYSYPLWKSKNPHTSWRAV